MKKINKWTLAALFLSLSFSYSCKKEEDSNSSNDNTNRNPNAYDISLASYAGEDYGIASEEITPTGMTFNTDGTKMFVIGENNDAVIEYDLTTSFDISTATYAGASEEFSVSSQELRPRSIAFNTDGTKMFVIGLDGDAVVEYSLSTGFDISTATYAGASEEFSVSNEELLPTGLTFNTDGTKMFVIGLDGDAVVEYSLSTGFDVSTATYAGVSEEFSITSQEPSPTGMAFNSDGKKMYVIGINDDIFEYNLSTGFDVSTATYAGVSEAFSVIDRETNPTGMAFNTDGTKMFVIGDDGLAVVEYNLSTSFDISTAVYAGFKGEFLVSNEETNPTGLSFNTDGTKMFVLGTIYEAVVEYNLTTAYDLSTAIYAGASEEFSVSGQETFPTGLSFNTDGTKMFVIGSSDDGIIEYDLSTGFDVSTAIYAGVNEEFSVSNQEGFPQGLAFNTSGTKMFVIGRENDAVIEYDLSTGFDVSTATYAGANEEFSVSSQETAPQGLIFNEDGTKMFIIGSSAVVLEYTLSTGFDVSTATYAGESEEFSVKGQETGPSGIAFSADGTEMFVIGFDGDAVVKYVIE